MATIINMPRLSDTMEEGVVASWLKKIGDKVEEGDILAEIETDKATMEFESFYEGTLLYIGVKEGETAPVDTLLAIIGEKGEDISSLLKTSVDSVKQETQETKDIVEKSKEIKIPEGVQVITMPRLSDTMVEGTVASWLKKTGDKVEEGDILAEIETDKATMEFESFYEGTLLYIGIKEGETAPVDSLLAIIGNAGEDVSSIIDANKKSGTNIVIPDKKNEIKTENKEEILSRETVKHKNDGEITNLRILASPLAKKIAKDKGIDLSKLKGSGDNGRIIKKDVDGYIPVSNSVSISNEISKVDSKTTITNIAISGEEKTKEVKNSQMRKAIAKALGNSKFYAPHFYLNIEVNMDNAIDSRKVINAIPDVKISFNDIIVKACAMSLRKHPQVNTSWTDNTTVFYSHIHVGIAVAVDEGLVVPVLKHADYMSLTQIGSSVRNLADKARNKKIIQTEMEGSTFTVSNLGMFGIDSFTSIINQPNSAILSVGAIVEKPIVKNGEIVVGNTMKLTLACDHRTVDGAVGAKFLQTLKTYIENPVTMIV